MPYSTSIGRFGSMRRRRPGSADRAGQPAQHHPTGELPRENPLLTGVHNPAGEGIEDTRRLLTGVDGRSLGGCQVREHDIGRPGEGFDQRLGRRMQRHRLTASEDGQVKAQLQFPGDTEPGLHPQMTRGPRGDSASVEDLAGGGGGEGLLHAQEAPATG